MADLGMELVERLTEKKRQKGETKKRMKGTLDYGRGVRGKEQGLR